MNFVKLTSRLARTALPAVMLCLVAVPTALAANTDLEVRDVRAENFPRIVVRLSATSDDLPLDGLTPDQLQVTEDGRPQPSAEMVQIRNPQTPVSVALAVDISGSMADADKIVQAQAAAKSFISQTRARDRVAIVAFNDQVSVPQVLTSDRRLLGHAIDGLQVGGNTRLYDALAQSVSQLALAPGGSRAVVVVTDGADTGSNWSVNDALTQAIRDGIPMYTVGLGSDVQSDVLKQLAAYTGGRYYEAPTGQDLAQVFRLISRQLSSQYEVSWISTQPDGNGRDVPVQISFDRPGAAPTEVNLSYGRPNFARAQPSTPSNEGRDLLRILPASAPTQDQVRLAAALAGIAAFLLFVGLFGSRVNRRLHARLGTYVAGRAHEGARPRQPKPSATRRTPLGPLTAAAARLATRLLPSRQLQQLRSKLTQAGHSSERQVGVFLASELALCLLLAAGAYQLVHLRGLDQSSPLMGLLIAAMLGLLGLYLPYMWLRRRVEARHRRLRRDLPDALDLMAISVSAGLSLDSAMLEVVQRWDGDLSRELQQVLTEMQLGVSRREALLNLVERTKLDELRLLVAALIQADELGANLSETLSVQAEQLRVRRRQIAEEKARKAPVKMLVPLVCFIFPAMFVVLLAPTMLQFLTAMQSLTHHG
jgi:tight adherence protein C